MLSRFQWRFFVLTLLITAPIYWLYYTPILFKKTIEIRFLDKFSSSHLEFLSNSMIIFYIFPNIFLLIFKRQLFQSMTLRRILFISSSALFLGEIFFELGFFWKSLYLMIFSRGLFGLGSETLFSMLNLLLLKYFVKEHVGILVGAIIVVSNIIGALSFPFSAFINHRFGIETVMAVNRLLVVASYSAALFTVFYDLYVEKASKKINILLENFKKAKKNDQIWLQDLFVRSKINRKPKGINYFLFSFAFFYIPGVVCFNNFGSSYLLEKHYGGIPLRDGYFNVSLVFCLLWFFATFSSSITSFYLSHNGPKNELLIYSSFLSVIAHFMILFFEPFIPAVFLGVSYGSTFSVLNTLVEKNGQRDDYILCFANLGLMVCSYFLAFFSQSGPFYYKCEILLFALSIFGLGISVAFFHQKEMKVEVLMERKKDEEFPQRNGSFYKFIEMKEM